ncbi:hypothetical protein R3P38DRAFT_3372113 [Favolaschia claudopus]|uniref:PH domain-containing protein n=1 Tax=Favolaschia claudopus TaxID=2862362 RepID=A0AAV9ZW30_9AGAR
MKDWMESIGDGAQVVQQRAASRRLEILPKLYAYQSNLNVKHIGSSQIAGTNNWESGREIWGKYYTWRLDQWSRVQINYIRREPGCTQQVQLVSIVAKSTGRPYPTSHQTSSYRGGASVVIDHLERFLFAARHAAWAAAEVAGDHDEDDADGTVTPTTMRPVWIELSRPRMRKSMDGRKDGFGMTVVGGGEVNTWGTNLRPPTSESPNIYVLSAFSLIGSAVVKAGWWRVGVDVGIVVGSIQWRRCSVFKPKFDGRRADVASTVLANLHSSLDSSQIAHLRPCNHPPSFQVHVVPLLLRYRDNAATFCAAVDGGRRRTFRLLPKPPISSVFEGPNNMLEMVH